MVVAGRMDHVAHEFRDHHIVCLQSTGCVNEEDYIGTAQVSETTCFRAYNFGRRKRGNNATGMAIWLRKAFWAVANVVAVVAPVRGPLVGRVGLLRVKVGSDVDIAVVSAYYPPEGAAGAAKLAEELNVWISGQLDKLPVRTLPLIAADASAKLGRIMHSGDGIPEQDLRLVGPDMPTHTWHVLQRVVHECAKDVFGRAPRTQEKEVVSERMKAFEVRRNVQVDIANGMEATCCREGAGAVRQRNARGSRAVSCSCSKDGGRL